MNSPWTSTLHRLRKQRSSGKLQEIKQIGCQHAEARARIRQRMILNPLDYNQSVQFDYCGHCKAPVEIWY